MPILATKLYIPQPRTNVVRRPRLIERLNEGLDRKLTLISVSAGFGKTTLVSEWVTGCGLPVAWVSLDEGDRDAKRFFNYFIAALQTITENFGENILSALNSQHSPSVESILTVLLNEISALPHKCIVVLDDYHAIGTKWIDEALRFLLEHLPSQMHLVIATREDPQLSLSRLRARGHMTELRAFDLRFTPDETATFLNQVMGVTLSEADLYALECRTEGWITGLKLAALSMQGRQDIPAFIRAFAGDNRYIVDYLVEEVLQRLPDQVRSFLLQTSILARLNGSLCDAVTGQKDGNARLESLERGNFFLIPLDDRRHWYRYHHLFADVLLARLTTDRPDQVVILHKRASLWYEQHGSVEAAIHHALAGKDFARAADLVELAIPTLRNNRQEAEVLHWLRALPNGLIQSRPVLSVGYAGALLSNGELEDVEDRLRDAEHLLETATDTDDGPNAVKMVVLDKEELRLLPGTIAMYRAGMALMLGDIPNTIAYAQQVLDLLPLHDQLQRGAATALLGLAAWRAGKLKEAHRMFADGIAIVQLAGAKADAINGVIALAEIRIAQGKLRQAKSIYEKGLQFSEEQGEPEIRGTADLLVGLSELYLEFNDLNTARNHLLKSKVQGERSGFPANRFRWYVAMAQIETGLGNLDGALDLLIEAEGLYVNDFFSNVRPISAMKARLWIRQGRLGDSFDWSREQGLSSGDDLHYLREFEHITIARLLLAQYKDDRAHSILLEAMGLLERLLQAAEEGERTGSIIEILILQAMSYYLQGDLLLALVPLERTLKLAEPEGYIQIFLKEGQPMEELLEAALKQGISLVYASRLRAAFGRAAGGAPVKNELSGKLLYEPLSERECDVLRLLGTDLSGPEIARELMISLNTLRSHTKNIYDKLEVNNRRAAVRRAEKLGLLS